MNLRQFDLNLLVALDALLKERNVTRAAERLYLSQPAMSGILSDPGHASVADEYLGRHGYERRIIASTESFTAAPFLLSGTSLLTMVPRRLGKRMAHSADIRLLELPFQVPPLREQLNWNPRFTASPAHVFMRELLTEVAAAL